MQPQAQPQPQAPPQPQPQPAPAPARPIQDVMPPQDSLGNPENLSETAVGQPAHHNNSTAPNVSRNPIAGTALPQAPHLEEKPADDQGLDSALKDVTKTFKQPLLQNQTPKPAKPGRFRRKKAQKPGRPVAPPVPPGSPKSAQPPQPPKPARPRGPKKPILPIVAASLVALILCAAAISAFK